VLGIPRKGKSASLSSQVSRARRCFIIILSTSTGIHFTTIYAEIYPNEAIAIHVQHHRHFTTTTTLWPFHANLLEFCIERAS
jgi:hypothetical protein